MEKEIKVYISENGKNIHCCNCGKTKRSIHVQVIELIGKIRFKTLADFFLKSYCKECYPYSFAASRNLGQLGIEGEDVKFI